MGIRGRPGLHKLILALGGFVLLAETWRTVQAPQCRSTAREASLQCPLRQEQEERGAAAAAANTPRTPQRFRPVYPQRLAALTEACRLPPAPPIKVLQITNIAVLGERHSGTNLVHQLVQGSVAGLVYDYAGLKRHGHKHFFQTVPEPQSDPINDPAQNGYLMIVMVRNPYDWVERMFRICYHCADRQKLSWKEFVTGEWNMTSPHDIHKVEQRPFRNIGEMRGAKVCHWIQYAQTFGLPVEVVRHEDVMLPSQQMELVRRLREAYEMQPLEEDVNAGAFVQSNLKANKNITFTIDSFEKASVYMRPDLATPQMLEQAALVNIVLDPAIERGLGYALLPKRPRAAAIGSPVAHGQAAASVAALQVQR